MKGGLRVEEAAPEGEGEAADEDEDALLTSKGAR